MMLEREECAVNHKKLYWFHTEARLGVKMTGPETGVWLEDTDA